MRDAARGSLLLSSLVAALLLADPTAAGARAWSSDVAALQVALRAMGLYAGDVDGVDGPATDRAVRAVQRRAGLAADGIVGRRTRSALGRLGRHDLGTRILRRGMTGWDVAELQFLLAWHGFPSDTIDGGLGGRAHDALVRFQGWAGLAADGRAGPATLAALRGPLPTSPLALTAPIAAPVGDRFGPRGGRFHGGLDFAAPTGTAVTAAAAGRVVQAGMLPGGFGKTVTVDHAAGVRTLYAHLSRVDVSVGAHVRAGTRVGLVGSTGNSTGPHLHFEVAVRGALVDPLSALR